VRNRLWQWWLGLGVLATAGYLFLPDDALVTNLAYNAIGLTSGLMILVAVRVHRPERPAMWFWFAAGQITWVVGDVVYEYLQYVRHVEPYPSVADVFYLGAYPMLVAGLLLLLVRERSRGDLVGLVDAAVIATGVGLALWIFVLHPIAADTSASSLQRAIGVAYPVADVLLLAMLARLFTSGARTPRSRLLGAAALLLLFSDVGFSVLTLYSSYDSGFLDAGWLLSYVLWAVAALHPSMRESAGPAPAPVRPGRGRMVLLTVSSLLAPGALFLPAGGADPVDRRAIASAAVVLFLLVLLRLAGFVKQVQRQADQLRDLAMRDDLTGLPNRRLFEKSLSAALAAGRPQVALLDLDGFKDVNDRLGHAVGDRLLTVLAARIRATVRADALVARMGGDEFAVLLPDAGPAEADVLVDCLAATLHDAIPAGEHELLIAASIGVADGTGTNDPGEVLRRADVAMYTAKERGDTACRFDRAMDESAGEHARLGAELRAALDTGQFFLVYQPIVALPEGRTVSVEALVRWHHPVRGLVNPADFIPVAEENGLIVDLGTWILRTACARMAGWRETLGDRAPSKVNVNVSARQLTEPGFVELVARTLHENNLPARCLAVEVTETAVFEGGRAVQALEDLHALGVLIALDDFGTGHSSLGLLQTVPVDILKVDKSFVDHITMAGRHAVIATALIQVSEGLGLAAVAEGVETREQAEELYRLGYRLAQGYHFGRPVAEPDFRPGLVGGHL
jgi:diguanylate cyclase